MRLLLSTLIACLVFSQVAFADADKGDSLLNTVKFELSSEQWVLSKSALVTVVVNASVNPAGLEKMQNDVMDKLAQLSNLGDWHITRFERTLDQSNLEKIMIEANARLPLAALTDLREKTKTISKAGMNFSLDTISFVPSEDELRAANVVLRGLIYQQAKEEVDRLNKRFPDQLYYVHHVNFINENGTQPVPMAMRAAVLTGVNNAPILGDKLSLNATVILAAMPNRNLLKNIP